MHLRSSPVLGFLVLAWATAAGCGGQTAAASGRGTLSVAVAFYPLEEIVRNVGGEQVRVVDLTPPGGEPHDLDLTPERAADLERADVAFYLGQGFQPAVEKAVAGLPGRVAKVDLLSRIDLLPVTPVLTGTNGEVDGEELAGGKDPHVWVDPENMVALTTAVAETLDAADPAHAADHARGANA